jgi:Ala-tRNA(Pro) deacylase
MKTQKELYDSLHQLNIKATTYEHEPLFTCEQAEKVSSIPGGHTKNLFLKDDKSQLWLINALQSTKIELKKTGGVVKAPNLRFAKPDLLMKHLGVEPGSVTPFGLINDETNSVNVILDKGLFDHELLNFHPLVNTATLGVSTDDFIKFLRSLKKHIYLIDFETYTLTMI